MKGNREQLWGLIDTEVQVIVGELLDIVLDETVDIPFEHWAVDV
jgi:hypothetical protein